MGKIIIPTIKECDSCHVEKECVLGNVHSPKGSYSAYFCRECLKKIEESIK